MPLDKQFEEIVAFYEALPALWEQPLEALRGAPPPPPEPTAVDSVEDRTIEGPGGELAARIYTAGSGAERPLLLFLHGGGFVLGNLDTHDELARMLTAKVGAVTVSVAYRLAPENPFPAASDDCLAALAWAAANARDLGADPARLVVIGDSAGGNLAALTALRARDENGPALAAQVLIYPVTELAAPMLPAPDGNFYILSPDTRSFFNEAYLADPALAQTPGVSPGLAPDLTRLPPTFVATAEYDPLCAQGEAFVARLRAGGTAVTHTRYAGAIHGFATFPVPMQQALITEIGAWLREHLR